jgi:hypothetical protein
MYIRIRYPAGNIRKTSGIRNLANLTFGTLLHESIFFKLKNKSYSDQWYDYSK